MSTPIEIVREYRLWQRRPVMVCGYTWNEPPHTREEYDAALASVLRDAERVSELERENARLRAEPLIALGFAYSWACHALDAGNDPRLLEVPLLKDAWDKAQAALTEQTKGTP